MELSQETSSQVEGCAKVSRSGGLCVICRVRGLGLGFEFLVYGV